MAATVLGHFGEWIQGRLGSQGPIGLVTVACPVLRMQAVLSTPGPFDLTGTGAAAVTMDRALRLVKSLQIVPDRTICLSTSMPLGGGAGASTAALVALAKCLAPDTPPDALARACHLAEGASDPLMWPAPDQLLWAPRAGRILATLPALPLVEVIGGFFGSGMLTDANDVDFPDITPLWADWQAAPMTPARLAALAQASASATTGLRGPVTDPIAGLAQDNRALGYLRAHTGSARGLIYPVGGIPPHIRDAMTEAGLTGIIQFATGGP